MSMRFTGPIRRAARFATLASTLTLTACGGQSLTRTGFLTNYDQLHSQPNHQDDAIYLQPGFSAANYTKVIIEPTAWVLAKNAPAREPETVARLQTSFHDDLIRRLSERFIVIPEPGPGQDPGLGVLRVRSAITNTRRALWWVNVPAQAAQLALGGVGILRPSAGGASEEMQVQDARTGTPVVEIATYNNGQPWNVVGSYVAYNHARRAFLLASDLLHDELVQGAPATASVTGGTQMAFAGPPAVPTLAGVAR